MREGVELLVGDMDAAVPAPASGGVHKPPSAVWPGERGVPSWGGVYPGAASVLRDVFSVIHPAFLEGGGFSVGGQARRE